MDECKSYVYVPCLFFLLRLFYTKYLPGRHYRAASSTHYKVPLRRVVRGGVAQERTEKERRTPIYLTPVLHRPQNQKKKFAHFSLKIIETGVW